MDGWILFSLTIIAVLLTPFVIWILSEQLGNRRRRKFLRRFPQRSIAGIRENIERELGVADTQRIPRIRRGRLAPDPLQEGRIVGTLSVAKRVRAYVLCPAPRSRKNDTKHPEVDELKRVLDGLRRL
jgi:hypothetical protein